MNRQSKLLFLLLSVMILCTLICGLYFFEADGGDSAAKATASYAAVMSGDGRAIVFTDKNGCTITEINIEGRIFTESEREALARGITVLSEEELMSLAEDYAW